MFFGYRCAPVLAVCALLTGGAASAHAANLVKDIRTANADAPPIRFASIGTAELFLVSSPTQLDLYRDDGTPGGTALVKSLPTVYYQSDFVSTGSKVFFAGRSPDEGVELWVSDGTTDGTHMVRDINPGGAHSNPSNLAALNGTVFFRASDGISGDELWKSDGTPEGTVRVKDIVPGSAGSNPAPLTAAGNLMFFHADDGVHGYELWKSDGTDAGTGLVKDLNAGAGSSNSYEAASIGGTLFFGGWDGVSSRLWKTDGTPSGTVEVRPGSGVGFPSSPYALTNLNGVLFFGAWDDASVGFELWKTDGTAAGTVLVKDIYPGTGSSNPLDLTAVSGTLFFVATDGLSGSELWKSDGSSAGTVLVKDLVPGPLAGEIHDLTAVGSTLYFSGPDGLAGGNELWRSDGSAGGTFIVKDILPGSSSEPRALASGGGLLYFVANEGVHGFEPWRSDGSESGTLLLADIGSRPGSSGLSGLVDVEGRLFFSADDGVHGRELWTSDGSAVGTVMPKDVGLQGKSGLMDQPVRAGNLAVFTGDARGSGKEVWASDGATAGTQLFADAYPGTPSSSPTGMTDVDGTVFFAADGLQGRELWKSNGTPASTLLVKDINTSIYWSSYPRNLTAFRNRLFFTATDAVFAGELWTSDGSAAGTTLVKNVQTGSPLGTFTLVGDKLFFLVASFPSSSDLWVSDGTAAGTVPLKHFTNFTTPDLPSNLVAYQGQLFFRAKEGGVLGLWRSDGTVAGTLLVKDFFDAFSFSNVVNLTVVNDTLYFTAWDYDSSSELWKTDGTTAGTVLVRDINPGGPYSGSSPESFVAANGLLYFSADDGVNGRELWRSNGTEAGTLLVQDIAPGSACSSPTLLTRSGPRIFFAADEGVHGQELWTHTLPATPNISISDAVVQEGNFGTAVASFAVTLSAPSDQTVTVQFATADGTATSPSDFSAASGTLTFVPGDVAKTVSITVNGDITDESTETFSVNLSNPSVDAAILDGHGVGTIVDEDPSADLSITKTDGTETVAPGQVLTYTITVGNAGPNDAPGALVSDALAAGLTNATWTCAASGGASCGALSGSGSLSEMVALPVGGGLVYTLTATVAPNPDSVGNTATVTVPSGFGDPNPSNNQATDDDRQACDTYTSLVADGRVTPGTLAATATAWYAVQLRPGASYSIELMSDGASAEVPTLTLLQQADGCSGTSTAAVRDTSSIEPVSSVLRGSFTVAGNDGRYRIRVQNETSGAVTYALQLRETTLYSAAWSTNASFNTYYSLQNTTAATVTAKLALRDTTGANAAVATLVLPPGSIAAINTDAMAAPRNQVGSAQITTDGPPGAIAVVGVIANFTSTPPYVQPVRFVAARD